MKKIIILLTSIFGLIAFFWSTGMTADLTAAQLDNDHALKPVLTEWADHSMLISLLLIGVLIIGMLLKQYILLTIGSLGLIVVCFFIFW